ncbi:uncharacterized protein V6R79_014178 [Siganus canaliculatus]
MSKQSSTPLLQKQDAEGEKSRQPINLQFVQLRDDDFIHPAEESAGSESETGSSCEQERNERSSRLLPSLLPTFSRTSVSFSVQPLGRRRCRVDVVFVRNTALLNDELKGQNVPEQGKLETEATLQNVHLLTLLRFCSTRSTLLHSPPETITSSVWSCSKHLQVQDHITSCSSMSLPAHRRHFLVVDITSCSSTSLPAHRRHFLLVDITSCSST